MSESQIHVWMPALRVGTGADVFSERLADSLRRGGVEVTLQWFDRRFEFFPPALAAVARCPAGANIVHANAGYAFAFRRFGLPVVATEHHYVMDPAYAPYRSMAQAAYHRGWFDQWVRRSFRDADALTTISRFTANAIKRCVPSVDPQVIYPWVDTSCFAPPSRRSNREGPFSLFFAGNSSVRKGGDLLPMLAHKLGDNFEIRFTGGLRSDAQEQAQQNLRGLGRLTPAELVRAFQDSDAVLVPSRYEGFGYSALEGMACGKPIIGFACGALEEVVSDDAGYLVPVDDIDSLVSRIRSLQSDPPLCAQMGLAGRQRAQEVFTEASGIEAYLRIYKNLLGEVER